MPQTANISQKYLLPTYLTKMSFLHRYFSHFSKLLIKFNNLKFKQRRVEIYVIYFKKQSVSIHMADQKFTAKYASNVAYLHRYIKFKKCKKNLKRK